MKLKQTLLAGSLSLAMILSLSTVASAANKVNFEQNTATDNTYGYVDSEVDQFKTYTTYVKGKSLDTKLYKPVSGDTLVVVFHGNGEGGVEGKTNNYTQLAGNRLAVTYTEKEIQEKFKGAYVLSFQAPEDWYHDHTAEAKQVIDQACKEFGIKQKFVSGLSAGGLMSERMLSTYPDFFDGALFSCAAIAKNGTYVEGLGGDYTLDYATLTDENTLPDDFMHPEAGSKHNQTLKLQRPADFNAYLSNYNTWLDKIAQSKTPLFMVHAQNDNTIASSWTKYAYKYISTQRQQQKNNAPTYYQIIDDTNYDATTSWSQHWSWIKMLNNDITDSTNTIKTIDFITSLSTSKNTYQEKETSLPLAGKSDQENTFKFNLVAKVKDDGEKVTTAIIDLAGKKLKDTNLDAKMFKVTAYATDATGIASSQRVNYGNLIQYTADKPEEIAVEKAEVDSQGNIVLTLANEGVLNYTAPASRNLPMIMHYAIAPMTLAFVEEENPAPVTPSKEKQQTPDTKKTPAKTQTVKPKAQAKTKTKVVKSGDSTTILPYVGIAVVALVVIILLLTKKKKNQ